jgi:hypothetical protein
LLHVCEAGSDFAVNRRAASDIEALAGKLNLLDEKGDDVAHQRFGTSTHAMRVIAIRG